MNKKIEKDRLQEIIDYLETKPKVKCDPYPSYDAKIQELLTSLGVDMEYMSNYEKISDKEINKMNLSNIKTMYTFILRGERFCDGHIMMYLEDETILNLAKREYQLLKK